MPVLGIKLWKFESFFPEYRKFKEDNPLEFMNTMFAMCWIPVQQCAYYTNKYGNHLLWNQNWKKTTTMNSKE